MKADLSVLTLDRAAAGAPAASSAEQVPQPRRRWKTRVLLPGAILAATTATLVYAAGDALWPATSVRVVPVMVKSGGPGEMPKGGGKVVAQAPGWVEADPYSTAVSALTDGIIQEVLVLEGETVEAGQVVARLVPDDARLALARAEAMLAAGEAQLRTAQANLKAAQDHWDNPIELQRQVLAAEAMLAEKRAELARWPAELAAREAKAAEAEADYQRVAALHADEQTSPIEYIRVRQEYLMRQAMADSMRAEKPILDARIQALEAEAKAAQNNLRLRIGDVRALEEARAAVAQAEADVAALKAARDEARLRLERTEVRSPVNGVVMTRMVEPGAKVMQLSDNMRSAYVVRLYDPRQLQVRVDVPLTDAAKVGVGQPAEVVVDVLPDRVFSGHVTRIVNEADVQKNTLQVKVAIHDPLPDLKPEMLARARFFSVGEKRADDDAPGAPAAAQSVYAPEALLRKSADGKAQVWLADQARKRAGLRTVALGRGRTDGWVEVDEGLLPGDRLIAEPPASLRDGQAIRIIGESFTNPANGGGIHHGAN